MKSIGIVGLGIMGKGMADNFLKHGHQLFVWNRSSNVAEEFAAKGATVCTTPAEVARKAELVFEVTANDESSQAVWLGDQGILAGATSQTIVVASATLSAAWTDQLIAECRTHKLRFLDIPLTGGRIGAETGNLTLLCGGDPETLENIKPDLNSIAGKIFHFGPEGHGMRYKLILNFVQATHIVVYGQAMQIAKDNGMDLHKVGEALADRPGGVITGITHTGYFKDPVPVTFSVEWITKDLEYAQQLAGSLDVSLLSDVLTAYHKVIDAGMASEDWVMVNKVEG